MTDEHKWFYLGSDDVPQGPVGRDQLLEMVKLGHARYDALVWRDGFSGWRPFRDVEQEWENPVAQPAATPAPSPVRQLPARPTPQKQPLIKPKARTNLAVGSGFAIAAIALVSALYIYSGPVGSDESSAGAMLRRAEISQSIDDAPEGPMPVRVQNPFDATEVFEFPPGTSESHARDAVADLLLKRALERRSRRRAT